MGTGGGPPPPHLQASAQSRPAAHLGSQGSHGGRGDSGHSEGHRTRAGTGSGQPRRSPGAGSPRCCSHTLRGRGAQAAEQGRQDRRPRPPVPTGEALLTLAEGEVEVARGTAVTRGPLEACPACALARVTVTVTVHHSGAGTLARCGTGGHTWSGSRGGGDGDGNGAGLTVAVLAVEPWGTELAVDALEVGFAQAASQLRVLLAGVVLGAPSVAVAA